MAAGLLTTALRETPVGSSLYVPCEPKERRATLAEVRHAYAYLRSNGHKNREPYVFVFTLSRSGIRATRQRDVANLKEI